MSPESNNEETINETDDQNKFTNLCEELECALGNAVGSLDDVLELKDILLEQSGIPCSLKLKLTLILGRLHRSMSDLGVPTGEITRLVRLYAVPWENKSKALKKLHQDYESKQHQLEIALKRLEMVSVHTMQMEREKRINNWEKLFAKLVGAKGHGQRWKFLIQQFKNRIQRGENVVSLYAATSDDENEDDDHGNARERVPFGRTFSERLRKLEGYPMKDDEAAEKSEDVVQQHPLSEEQSETSTTLHLSDTNSVISLDQDTISVSSHGHKKVRFDDDDDHEHEMPDKNHRKSSLSSSAEIATQRATVEMMDKECWTHEPDVERMFHIRVFKPICKTVTAPWCSISFDKQLRKTGIFKDMKSEEASEKPSSKMSSKSKLSQSKNTTASRNIIYTDSDDKFQEFIFKLDPEFDERDPDEIFLKMSVHPENKKNMIAMVSLKLTDLAIAEEEELNNTQPTAYEIKSMVNNSELIFNKPCGNLNLVCFYSNVYLPVVISRGTETLSIDELTERIIAMRKAEFSKRLKSAGTSMTEKPIYTEEQMSEAKQQLKSELLELREEYEEKLGLMISQLNKENEQDVREFVNAATSPLFMWSQSRVDDSKDLDAFTMASNSNKPVSKERKKSPKKTSRQKSEPIWGENLPKDFYERMEMFQEASSKHHQQLKEKVNETTEREIEKKLAIQNRLDTSSNSTSFPKEVCLPALFMPTKTRNVYSSKARSYFHAFGTYEDRLTQPPSILQLPRLKSTQDDSDTIAIYESASRKEMVSSPIRNDTVDENQLDRFSDNSSITIEINGGDTNEYNEDI